MTDDPGADERLPLVISVTGHRDLVAAERDGIAEKVRDFFAGLFDRYPSRRLTVLCPLAEGADQLVAEVALECGVDLVVPLPMPVDEYLRDFSAETGIERFHAACRQATDVFVVDGLEMDDERTGWSERDRRYAELGIYLAAHCHILLAIWDGMESHRPGGTGHVVRFHHDETMPGLVELTIATQRMLVDDESDLVYHIVCSRNRPDGLPAPGLRPLECWWFTKDEAAPRSAGLPEQHERIFRRSAEFSADALRFRDDLERERASLLSDIPGANRVPGAAAIDRLFGTADWLALRYQHKTLQTLHVVYALGFTMGLMFILYSDFRSWQPFLIVFLGAFLLASAWHVVAKRRGWQRKYLDYRALAEGLRVQFYWTIAGVRNDLHARFTHDNFLQAQDPEIGWIRNVMRVAGIRANAAKATSGEWLELVIRQWVGESDSGQLGYFRAGVQTRLDRQRWTEGLGRVSLALSAVAVAVFLVAGDALPDRYREPLSVSMGVLLLVFAMRYSFASAIAEQELLKQYDFMFRVFTNANRRLAAAVSNDEKRQILLALGTAAIDEQAQWLMRQRERTIDNAEIWRMGS